MEWKLAIGKNNPFATNAKSIPFTLSWIVFVLSSYLSWLTETGQTVPDFPVDLQIDKCAKEMLVIE